MNIVDRRLNPQGKSLPNRQRFLRRAKDEIRKAVINASAKRSVTDVESGGKISISTDGIREPGFRHGASGGQRDYVLPGNREYVEGDKIARPPRGGGEGGREASDDGDGVDEFRFMLSKEEFLDIFLEDLELPDLTKRKVKQSEAVAFTRAGYSVSGSPANLNVVRTMRNSLSRRLALKRPRTAAIEALEAEIEALRGADDPTRLAELEAELEALRRRARLIPYVDPFDVRYNRFESVPKPMSQAVMFCLMDVSGSMTEHMKDLAKRFFMLLYVFLQRRYRQVDIVFIRHTHRAAEVDEQTFFYSPETGGTVVSTALAEMRRVVAERYPIDDWNIYAAQASDGDNVYSDNARVVELIEQTILPMVQYFAYLEVSNGERVGFVPTGDSALWRAYGTVAQRSPLLAMRRVSRRTEIYPVFRELFARGRAEA